MEDDRRLILLSGMVLLALLVVVGLFYLNYNYAAELPFAGEKFLPRWEGSRIFLTEGISPYSEEASNRLRRSMADQLPGQPEAEALFLYPFYSIFIFAPFGLIADYQTALAAWMVILELALFTVIALSVNLSRWKMPGALLAALVIFLSLWIYSVPSIIAGEPAILQGLLILIALIAIRSENDVLAGVALALATFKPQVVLLLVPFILFWAARRERWSIFWSTIVTLAFMVGVTSLFFPAWLWDNFLQTLVFVFNTGPATPGEFFFRAAPGAGRQFGWFVTVFSLGILFWEWRAALQADFNWLVWTVYLTLVLSVLVGVPTSFTNYIVFLPAVIIVLSVWVQRWGRLGGGLVVGSLLIMFFGLWLLYGKFYLAGVPLEQSIALFLILPVFLIIGLYWVRWWWVRPPRLLIDELAERIQ